MNWKKRLVFILKTALFLPCLLILMGKSGSSFPAESFQGTASPYLFSIIGWEGKHVLSEGWRAIRYGSRSTTDHEDIYLVNRYENLKYEINSLEKVLPLGSPATNVESQRDLRARLDSLNAEKKELEVRVKFILESQISLELEEAGLTYHFPTFRSLSLLLPAVSYSASELPNLLIISPREKIEITETILLIPDMSLTEMVSLESMIERRNVSALVERVGGIATYPSLLSGKTDLATLLEGISHEWFHQYLFFRPLGRNYSKSYQMTTINETVADIGGKEIANIVLERYYPEIAMGKKSLSPLQRQGTTKIDFNREMRNIRLKVDDFLSQGKIIEAENFMDESRINLAGYGYFIRKINQAYFAFHGSYGESPGSTSPIGPLLHQIRERSASLGDFIRIVSAISASEQLEEIGK